MQAAGMKQKYWLLRVKNQWEQAPRNGRIRNEAISAEGLMDWATLDPNNTQWVRGMPHKTK